MELAGCPLTLQEVCVLQKSEYLIDTSDIGLAEALFCSPATVKEHWKHIYKKLDVQHRSKAVQIALQNGWITRSTPP